MFDQQKGQHRGISIDVGRDKKWIAKCGCGWESKKTDYFVKAKEEREEHWGLGRWIRSEPGEDDSIKKYFVEFKGPWSDGKSGCAHRS